MNGVEWIIADIRAQIAYNNRSPDAPGAVTIGVPEAQALLEIVAADTKRFDAIEAFLRLAATFDGNPKMGLQLVPAGKSFAVIVIGPDDMLVAPSIREALDKALEVEHVSA